MVAVQNAKTMRDLPHEQLVYLYAGDIIFGRGYREVRTLLGSCISIVLYHPQRRFCGMCHFAMPYHNLGLKVKKLDPRYGDHCLALFERFAHERETKLQDYEARIYGGGNLLGRYQKNELEQGAPFMSEQSAIGEKNAGAAFSLLMQYHVKILEVDVGETCYRKIYLNTKTADVDCLCCYVK